MKISGVIALVVVCIAVNVGFSQETNLSSQKGESSMGIGLGLSYGGIGMRFGSNAADGLNIFGSVGYQLAGVGFNLGLLKDFKSSSLTQFYLLGMYGTNAAIKVIGLSEYDKVYTGGTFGLGIKVNSRKTEGNFMDIGLLAPIRSSSYKSDEKAVENDSRVSGFTKPWPILIVIGYNFHL